MLTTLDSASLVRIPTDVAEVFQEVQVSSNNHQRNCVKLFKIHDEAHAIRTEATTVGEERLRGGHIFQNAFLKCLCTALLQRDNKLDVYVKRVAQFTGAYFEFVNKKGTVVAPPSRRKQNSSYMLQSVGEVCCSSRGGRRRRNGP